MCAVSMIQDFGRQLPVQTWQPDTWTQFQQLLEELRKIDKKLDLPDCEDPKKAEWMKEVEERLRKLERVNVA